MALAIPHRSGQIRAAWSPAATPNRAWPSERRADSAMMLTSASRATASPAPTATPLMAETIGLTEASISSTTALASRHCSTTAPWSVVILSTMARSPPAEKARPAPVITDTATESSASTTDQTSESSRCSRSLAALSTSGRSMVIEEDPGCGPVEPEMLEVLVRPASTCGSAEVGHRSSSGWRSPSSASDRSGSTGSASGIEGPVDPEDIDVPERGQIGRLDVGVEPPLDVGAAGEARPRSNCSVHHSNEAMVRWPSTNWPSASTARSASGTGPGVVGPEVAVVLDPLGSDLALEVPVGTRPVGPEGGNGGVEVAAAHPAQLGQGGGHPVGRQVLEDLERGHQLECAVLPGEAGEEVGHPNVADGPRGGVIDGELAHVAALGVDASLAEHLHQEAGGTADVE